MHNFSVPNSSEGTIKQTKNKIKVIFKTVEIDTIKALSILE